MIKTIGRKSAATMRKEAYQLALASSRQRFTDGDPEGAGVIKDLANDIKKLSLRP